MCCQCACDRGGTIKQELERPRLWTAGIMLHGVRLTSDAGCSPAHFAAHTNGTPAPPRSRQGGGIVVESYSPLAPIVYKPGGPLDALLQATAAAHGVSPAQVCGGGAARVPPRAPCALPQPGELWDRERPAKLQYYFSMLSPLVDPISRCCTSGTYSRAEQL